MLVEHKPFVVRTFPYKGKIEDSVLIWENGVRRNPYSGIFYAV